jgi:DNA-binding SARP family transcriptional activator
MARLLEAHIELDDGRDEAALTALRRAMMLGRQGGYSTTYGWRPTVMARLCARALEAGIEVDYVDDLVRKRRLLLHPPSVEIEAWPWPVRVYTLGNFAVVRHDRPLTFTHKVQRRPLELLKALIAFGGRDVREEALVDALWPEAEGDAAHLALTAALHRLRRLLGHNDALVRREGRVGINPSMVWVDAWAVEGLLQRAAEAVRARHSDDPPPSAALTDRALALYRGAFLAQEPDYAWTTPLRDRLARRLLHQVTAEAQAHVGQRRWEAAARRFEQALSVDPCAEDVARALIGSYKELGRTSDADRVYTALRGSLQAMRGAGPARETQDLWQSVRAG